MARPRYDDLLTHHRWPADGLAGDDGFSLLQPYAESLSASWLWAASVIAAAPAPDGSDAVARDTVPEQPSAAPVDSAPQDAGGVVGGAAGGPGAPSVDPHDGSDVAMGANIARGTYGVDGTGIKIGILSDSFNFLNGETADITAGYLPAASDIHILKEGFGSDEGRAMAQLAHTVAPGAQLYFYTAINGLNDMAAGVDALAAAGCKVIVDDYVYYTEPFFQDGDVLQTAVENVVQQGVAYFTAADNAGNNFYEHSWVGMTTTLPGVSGSQTAYNFGTAGSPNAFENISVVAGGTMQLSLQWDQPFASIGSGHSSDDSLSMYLFDNSGTLVTSIPFNRVGGDPSQFLQFTASGSGTVTYQLAIVDAAGPAPGLFKVIDFGSGTFSDPGGGTTNVGSGSGTVIGHEMVPVANTVGAVNYLHTPAINPSFVTPPLEPFSASGPGEFLFDSSGNRLASPLSTDKVDFTAPDGSATSVTGFTTFSGTSAAAPNAAAVAALMLQKNPHLTPAQITSVIETTALATGGSSAARGAGFIQSLPAVQEAACYVRGTRVATVRGMVPIEQLRAGDQVMTLTGALPVRWIGRRWIDLTRHSRPDQARPIRIRRHDFAKNIPQRDLLLSPDHAVFLDGVLIPIKLLVNGGTIVQDCAMQSVQYFHLELERHAILFAEGLRAESYLDTGNRSLFSNAAGPSMLFPDFAPPIESKVWQRDACAPLVCDAAQVAPVRRRLAARSRRIGLRLREAMAIGQHGPQRPVPDEVIAQPDHLPRDHCRFLSPRGLRGPRQCDCARESECQRMRGTG